MRRAARPARPRTNALTTGKAGSVAAEAVASSGMTTARDPAAATRAAAGTGAAGTEEVSGPSTRT